MCRCVCCDVVIEKPQVDGRDGTIRPCRVCEEAIYEAAGELEDQEDELDVIPFLPADSNL